MAIRRRRRTELLEHESAVAATLAAAGFNRSPLDDEDDPALESGHSRHGSTDPFLRERSSSSGLVMSSIPSAGRITTGLDYDPHHPYSDSVFPANDGRVPSPPFVYRPYRPRSTSDSMGENISGHNPQLSGSHEPLLATYNRASRPSTGGSLPPQRLPEVVIDPPAVPDRSSSPCSVYYSSESTGDHRLDPILRQKFQDDADSSRDVRDEEDYSRPVLGVCALLLWCLLVSLFLHRFEIYLMSQARHLLYDNTSLSLSATFTYTIMTASSLSIERS